jgi:hypothetical protein
VCTSGPTALARRASSPATSAGRSSSDARVLGVVAKKHASLFRAGERGWVKTKNPNYWRRGFEREAIARKHERRVRTLA